MTGLTRATLSLCAGMLVALFGCGDEGPSCGEGTELKDGKCVLAKTGPSCGAGTAEADGVCVQPAADGSTAPVPDSTAADGTAQDSFGAADSGSGDGTRSGDAGTDAGPSDAGVADASGADAIGLADAATPASTCDPFCDDKACGTDGCGGSCGVCGDGATCNAAGGCVPKAWTCNPFVYGNGSACDCDCGAVDPDCANSTAPVVSDKARSRPHGSTNRGRWSVKTTRTLRDRLSRRYRCAPPFGLRTLVRNPGC